MRGRYFPCSNLAKHRVPVICEDNTGLEAQKGDAGTSVGLGLAFIFLSDDSAYLVLSNLPEAHRRLTAALELCSASLAGYSRHCHSLRSCSSSLGSSRSGQTQQFCLPRQSLSPCAFRQLTTSVPCSLFFPLVFKIQQKAAFHIY